MRHSSWVSACVLGFVFVAPVASQQGNRPEGGCDPVDPNLEASGEWHCFSWEAPGTPTATPVFLTGPYRIDVTDCSCPGDEFEVRVDGPNRHHYRLFCLLEREGAAVGLGGPSLVIIAGSDKPFRTVLSAADYAAVRALETEYRSRTPRSVEA